LEAKIGKECIGDWLNQGGKDYANGGEGGILGMKWGDKR